MVENKYTNKNKTETIKRIVIILVAIISLLLTLFVLKSCFSSEIKASDENVISESTLNSYQSQIDDLTNIELNDENRNEIQRRIIKIKELLDSIPDEYKDFLNLDQYERMNDYINGLDNQDDLDNNKEEFKIEVLTNNKTYGTVTGSGTYKKGEIVSLQAKPNNNYIFVSWDDGNKDNPRKITVKEDKTYTAKFSMMCTIKTSVNKSKMGSTSGDGEYLLGSKVTLYAYPNNNYEFDYWSDGNTDNPRTIIVSGSQTYVAMFSQSSSNSYVSVSDSSAGYVTGGDDLDVGEMVTLTAIANKGYKFVRWSDGNTDNPRRVVVKANTEYKAIFEAIVYEISWDSRGIGKLTFASSTATVKSGIGLLPDIELSDEYKFVGWYTSSSDYSHTGGSLITSSSIPDGNTTYYAVYAKKQPVYRSSKPLGQSETLIYESKSDSSCWVPNYPEYYVSTTKSEEYISYEQNASVCGTTRVNEGYHCSVHDFDGCSPTTCSNATDSWYCCCGTQYSTRANSCNVTHTKTCPAYYEITSWSDFTNWSIEYIENKNTSENLTEIIKVEKADKYVYDDTKILD